MHVATFWLTHTHTHTHTNTVSDCSASQSEIGILTVAIGRHLDPLMAGVVDRKASELTLYSRIIPQGQDRGKLGPAQQILSFRR